MELKTNEFFDMGNTFDFNRSTLHDNVTFYNPFILVFDNEVDYVSWVCAQIESNKNVRNIIGLTEGEKYKVWIDDIYESEKIFSPDVTITSMVRVEGMTYDNKPYFRDVKLKHVMNLNVCKNMIESMKEQE